MKFDGGPAFACAAGTATDADVFQTGLSLRDYFAAAAIQGICRDTHLGAVEAGVNYWRAVPQIAYNLADAMLAEREKQ